MFHNQTTLILAAALLLVTPVVVWLILPKQEHRAKEVWCLGNWMAGVGLVLVILRPVLPVPVSFHLANTLVLGFFISHAQSFRIILRCGWTARGWWLRLGLCLLLYSAMYAFLPELWRVAALSLTIAVLAFQVAVMAWRVHQRIHNFNAVAMAAAQLFLCLVFIAHAVLLIQGVVEPSPVSQSWNASPMAVGVVLISSVSAWCYVGMAIEVAAHERMRVLQSQQTSLQSELLGHQITHLDRRGRMSIVSGSLAHELNQPLTAAAMNTELAMRLWQQKPVSDPMLLQLLDQIEAGLDRTVRILQRIRQGHVVAEEHQTVLNLQTLLDRTLMHIATDLRRADAQVVREGDAEAVWCRGDELGLSQVLVNLLRNAAQAVTAQQTGQRLIWVRCASEHGQALLEVRDCGPGMPESLIAKWGQPFESARSDGMGLGLAISKEIVQRHRGQLTMTNIPGGGLKALLCLPLAEVRT